MKNQINHKSQFLSLLSISCLFCTVLTQSSCQKFLDVKPDKTLVVPQTLADCQALADDYYNMNSSSPTAGEVTSDDYYVNSNDYSALSVQRDQQNYIWQKDAVTYDGDWFSPYVAVYESNLILETLSQIPISATNAQQWNNIKGAALFYRAFAFSQLLPLYTKPFNKSTASNTPGIVLKLNTSISEKLTRATLQQCYDQVLQDLQIASHLLPAVASKTTRPVKAAAFGLLARVYLQTGNYQLGADFADSCLSVTPKLLDYNTLDTTSQTPIPIFNSETIYYSNSPGTSILSPPICRIDSDLYRSYATNDLRRLIYFTNNFDGTYSFQGGYDGIGYGTFFTGIATDEIYLTRAESLARLGQVDPAMADLNELLKKRYKTGTFTALSAGSADAAIKLILKERRKELLFRGLRWPDLRRLNQDPEFQVILTRNLNNVTYNLPPNDPRYVQLIPQEVISQSGIIQNLRN